jgi:hypothetical protein
MLILLGNRRREKTAGFTCGIILITHQESKHKGGCVRSKHAALSLLIGAAAVTSACAPAALVAAGHAAHPSAGGVARYDNEPAAEEASGPIRLAASTGWCITWIRERGSIKPVLGDPVLLEPCLPGEVTQHWSAVRTEGGFGVIQIPGTQLAIGWKGRLGTARLVDDSANDPSVTFVVNFLPTSDAWEVELNHNGFNYLGTSDLPRPGIKIYRLDWQKYRDTTKFKIEWLLEPWRPIHSGNGTESRVPSK